MSEIVGRSLTAFTVIVNGSDAVPPSASVTWIVIVELPDWLAAGVMVIVRFDPLPPNTMLPEGTRAELLVVAVSVRPAAAVSVSLIVKAMAPVATSSLVD